ncbi:hypothetical protein, partial [Pseudomonas turukhanskensis]|uniref:hypothetical protein n=1 Tax=Pseudomonas turukhanskensis TaxID=1806536 RepID=UPI0022F2E762
WYENQEVNGQLALVPRVYLSQATVAAREQDAKSSALVTADTVLIDAEAVANINGTVRGNTDTFIYSKTGIQNVSVGGAQAGLFAGLGGEGKPAGQLVIAAEGKVINQGGVMSGYQQTVVGGDGVSSSATTGYDKNGSLVVRDNGLMGAGLSEDKPKEEAKEEATADPQPTVAEADTQAEKKPLQVARPDVRALFEERLASGPVDTSQGS